MTVKYNRVITDAGKGRQMLRRSRGHAVLANGTVIVVIDQIPVPFRVRRVLTGSAVATNITGDCNVLALAQDADLDTAAGAGNQLITAVPNFTTKKLLDSDAIATGSPGALTAFGKTKLPAGTVLVLSVAHNAAVVAGDVHVIVEWDAVGTSYGAYYDSDEAAGTYE
jgi:hypothetical protein